MGTPPSTLRRLLWRCHIGLGRRLREAEREQRAEFNREQRAEFNAAVERILAQRRSS